MPGAWPMGTMACTRFGWLATGLNCSCVTGITCPEGTMVTASIGRGGVMVVAKMVIRVLIPL